MQIILAPRHFRVETYYKNCDVWLNTAVELWYKVTIVIYLKLFRTYPAEISVLFLWIFFKLAIRQSSVFQYVEKYKGKSILYWSFIMLIKGYRV